MVFPAPLAPTINAPFIIIIIADLYTNGNIQMDLLVCTLLRKEIKKYQLKHAFAEIKSQRNAKMVNLSFRDQQAFAPV